MESDIATRLERTLEKLQSRVREQEDILEKLRASATPFDTLPSSDIKTHLRQLQALQKAYESVTPTVPYFPSSGSVIPAIISLRVLSTCIEDTKATTTSTEIDLKKVKQRLEKEQLDLRDAKLIQTALRERISSLKDDVDKRTQKTPIQIAKDMIREVKRKQRSYHTETGKLIQAFNEFIDEELAPMLAAEELGGPIVGSIQDIGDEMLEAGFSSQGKAKKVSKKSNDDKHQRRIDQIWGPRPQGNDLEKPWDERVAAAAEMRDLTELLLNSLVEAEGNGPGVYIDLPRESAASRFLVRSKVAQFHPKDARKLRLIDFGGEVDD